MKQDSFLRRKRRVRYKLRSGNPNLLRLTIYRSNCNIYAQVIDDREGKTLCSASSIEKEIRSGLSSKRGLERAYEIGRIISNRAKEKKITKVKFDRGGYAFHGIVANLAKACRDNGLEF